MTGWRKTILLCLTLVVLAGNLGLLGWYLFRGYRARLHSDAACTMMYTREMVETGQYFPQDWNNVNGDLAVLSPHALVAPLLKLLPAGYLAHAIFRLLSVALILSGTWFLTGLFDISRLRRLAIITVLAAGISGFLAENLYGQVSYGLVYYFSCYIVFFAWMFLNAEGRRKLLFGIGLFVTLAAVFWANPQRATVAYALPLLGAAFCHVLAPSGLGQGAIRLPPGGRRWLAVVLAAMALGAALHGLTLRGVNNVQGAADAHWLSYDEMLRNAAQTFKGFLAIFGGLPSAASKFGGKSGAYQALRLATALGLLILIPLAVHKAFRAARSSARFVAAFALGAFALTLFVQLASSVPDMNDPVQSSRYLVPSLLLLLVVALAEAPQFSAQPLLAALSAGVLAVLAASGYPALMASSLSSEIAWGQPGQHRHGRDDLLAFLESQKLRYGYASYWNASVLSELSDERVRVRPIILQRGVPMPMRYLTSNRWYRPEAWQGETFVLLGKREVEELDWDAMRRQCTEPTRELTFQDFTIYVFAQNLAETLAGWDTHCGVPMRFAATRKSMSLTGTYHDNYDGVGSALVAEPGEAGVLHFGPYISVDPGEYTATFDVAAEPSSDVAARLDVAAARGGRILAESLLKDADSPRQLNFSLKRTTMLEFRVISTGNGRVVFRDVSIAKRNAEAAVR